MGAWGEGPLDSDQALDWLANEVTDRVGPKIRNLIDRFNEVIEREGGEAESSVDRYAHELRAAAEVVLALNFWSERLHGDLHADLAKALTIVRDCDEWTQGWTDPEALCTSIQVQIERLESGPDSTTLFENLEKKNT